MTLAEAHQLLASNRELIMVTWHFFVSVHLALFAVAMFSPMRRESHRYLLALLPFYFGFAYLNYNAQLDNYVYGSRLLEYIGTLATGPNQMAILTAEFRKGWVLPYLAPIYISTAAFSTLIVFWFAFRGGGRPGGR